MQHHPVVRGAPLVKEKEATRLRDKLNAERLALRWVRVEKTYVFDTPTGNKDARRPAAVDD
jgi:predicted dithiol-disulfide oxidoreductase (DUF899 family)